MRFSGLSPGFFPHRPFSCSLVLDRLHLHWIPRGGSRTRRTDRVAAISPTSALSSGPGTCWMLDEYLLKRYMSGRRKDSG